MIIEDAAHALGATYRGRAVGSISHMSVFSFHPVKHLTTGEGGMVTTDDAGLARRLRLFRSHGIDRDARERQSEGTWYYEMTALGYNYRLTDIACALGLAQLPRLDANLARRRAIAARYGDALSGSPNLKLPHTAADVAHAWHLYPVRVVRPSIAVRCSVRFAPKDWASTCTTFRCICTRTTATVSATAAANFRTPKRRTNSSSACRCFTA